ncbi:MAG: hypothetical protein ACTSUQ_13380 [Candidatus Freyarchaeota archaeon]
MFLSKKSKALKGSHQDKTEYIENMTKILFEEVSSINRRLKILEQQMKTIIQEVYGFRKLSPDYIDIEKEEATLMRTPEIDGRNGDIESPTVIGNFLQPLSREPSHPSDDFSSPSLARTPERDVATFSSPSFTPSPTESAHPPTPTFPGPSPNEEKEESEQRDAIYHLIPRVKLATKNSSNRPVTTED